MNSQHALVMPIKTMFTPMFYSQPPAASPGAESSSTATPSPRPSVYLERLSRAHIALAQMAELPCSRPSSPSAPMRVQALQAVVADTLATTKHDLSDVRWGPIASALQMSCVRGGYRWYPVNIANKPVYDGENGWLLAETEEQWLAWERKADSDAALRAKVQSWKKRVEAEVPPSEDLVLGTAISEELVVGGSEKGKAMDFEALQSKASVLGTGTFASERLMDEPGQDGARQTLETEAAVLAQGPPQKKFVAGGHKKPTVASEDSDEVIIVEASEAPRRDNVQKAVEEPKASQASKDSRLSFPVVKRASNLSLTGKPSKRLDTKGKGKAVEPPASNATAGPSNYILEPPPASISNETDAPAQPKKIADVSDFYLPPSFSSQLVTSTPNPVKPLTRTKPPPILPNPSSSPPLLPNSLGPPPNTAPPPLPASSALPSSAIVPSSIVVPSSPSPLKKRSRPLTPPSDDAPYPATKKARAAPSSALVRDPVLSAPVLSGPGVSTPPQSTTSSPRDKGKARAPPVTPPRADKLPTLTELLASKHKPKPAPWAHRQLFTPRQPAGERSVDGLPGLRLETALPGLHLDAEAGLSPTKSLSSLAASDSDSDDGAAPNGGMGVNLDTQDSFAPIYMSTQAGARGGGADAGQGSLGKADSGFFAYSSQFNLDAQLADVDKFVGMDVNDWLRDTSPEEDDEAYVP